MDIKNRLTNNGQPFKIQHKYRGECLVPDIAIDNEWFLFEVKKTNVNAWKKALFITSDNVQVHIEIISIWREDNPKVPEKIKELYKHSLSRHKSFYNINNNYSCWHYIKMVKI